MRAYLIVPAGSQAGLTTALASGADALVLVAASAFSAIRRHVETASESGRRPQLLARVSGADDPALGTELDAVMPAAPGGLLMPAAHGRDVAHLGARLAVQEAEHGLPDGSTRILALVDTARGALAAASFVDASPRLAGLAWDAQALAAELGAGGLDANGPSGPLAQARSLVRLAAAAAGIEAIEAACPGGDRATVRAAVARARRDGFAAMLARTPAELALIREA